MRKMQEIQPEVKAIQDRYAKLKATDPAKQKMNQELMALYREKRRQSGERLHADAADVSGLPRVLRAAARRRSNCAARRSSAGFTTCRCPIPTTSCRCLMGATQILQQWMTPQAGVDPAQQKMMMFMPVVLIFVFVSTPAGALIYWLVGNVWRIGQHAADQLPASAAEHPRRCGLPAERRVKRVGGGKTRSGACARELTWPTPTAPDRRLPRTASTQPSASASPVDVEQTRRRPAPQLDRRRGRDSRAPSRRAAQGAAARRRHGVRPQARRTSSACSSMRSGTARARTPSCGRWRSTSPRRRRRPASTSSSARSIPYERRLVHLAAAEVPACHGKRRRRVLEDRH